jgi:signal peptidase II
MFLFGAAAVLALVVSLIAKFFVDTFLHTRLAIIGSFAGLEPVHNPGVAFGVQLPGISQEILILSALTFVCFLAWKTKQTTASSIGYGLIVGGALANVLDRLMDGVVTDFFQIGGFAIFNVADSCITIGVVFLLAEIFGIVRNK